MGYHSDTAYAVEFAERGDLDALLAALPAGDLERLLADGLRIRGAGLRFHDPGGRWYATRLGAPAGRLADAADRHERLLEASKRAHEQGVPLVGVFVRVGEDPDDAEEDRWGLGWDDGVCGAAEGSERLRRGGLPRWSDLLRLRRSVVGGRAVRD